VEKLKLSGQKSRSTDDQLRGLSAVLVDGDEVYIDNGAIHAKSRVEQGITFVKERDELESPREIWCFWLTLVRREGGAQGYKAMQGFPMYIESESKRGYKLLSESVNKLDKVVKGQMDLSAVPQEVVAKVRAFLQSATTPWDNAFPEFREAFDR